MTMWTSANPGAGIPQQIDFNATERETEALQLRRDTLPAVRVAIAVADSAEWVGAVPEAFTVAVEAVIPEIVALAQMLDSDAQALHRYAVTVDEIAYEAGVINSERTALDSELKADRRLADGHRQEIRALGPMRFVFNESHAHKLVLLEREEWALRRVELRIGVAEDRLQELYRRNSGLEQQRIVADRTCIHALSGAASRGGLAYSKSGAPTSLAELLSRASELSAVELAMLLRAHPGLADLLAQATPDQVAELWGRYAEPVGPDGRSSAHLMLLSAAPAAFGNLVGIPFWARDLANRQVVAELRLKIEALEKSLHGLTEGGELEHVALMKAGYSKEEFKAMRDALLAIDKSLSLSDGVIYQLVEFHPGNPPLAAISVGDLDTADHVTVAVPGMDTTVGNSMENWTTAAQNVYDGLGQVGDSADLGQEKAVVAWLGYDTPGALPSDEVFNMDKAEAGAIALQGFLEGVTATRGWEPGKNLAVLAHSYGSTTASVALTRTPVDTFITIGSAGIDPAIASVDDVLVPEGRTFSTLAAADDIAPAGVLLSRRTDPGGTEWGSQVFTAEASENLATGEKLHSVTGHGILDNSASNPESYGYLDKDTSSLQGISLALRELLALSPVCLPEQVDRPIF